MRTNRQGPEKCRYCNAEILMIKSVKDGHRYPADAEPVWIRQQTGGATFMTKDGRWIFGFEAGDADDDPDSNLIKAYIPHKAACPGRGPRKHRRPSGYR